MITLDTPRKTAAKLLGVVLLSGVLVWVYAGVSRVTAYGGITSRADLDTSIVLDQTIKVRFDASKARDMPLEFKPVVREMTLRIGEIGQAFFEIYNPTDRPVAARAYSSVSPDGAGSFLDQTDCFCISEQVLQPAQRMQLPVSFFVDPAIVDDRAGKYMRTITLSYTFYQIDLPEGYAALDAKTDTQLN